MYRIILDTNFLMIPGQFKVDIFAEIERIMDFKYELCLYKGTITELKKLAETAKLVDRVAAKLALVMIKQKGLKTLPSSSNKLVDDVIVEKAEDNTIVATVDSGLKKRLKQQNIKTIVLRQRKYLQKCFTS